MCVFEEQRVRGVKETDNRGRPSLVSFSLVCTNCSEKGKPSGKVRENEEAA